MNAFQDQLYAHLVAWKHANITTEIGPKGPITLPKSMCLGAHAPHIYAPVRDALAAHRTLNQFRFHLHYHHMASSQAAAINLFLPLVVSTHGAKALGGVNSDIEEIERRELDNGYCIEFWGGNFDRGGAVWTGPLGDKSATAGTDCDFAIAYRDADGQSCLWLIEHKLTEAEFTRCKGATSGGRKPHHDCNGSLGDLLRSSGNCYLDDVRKFKYWQLTRDANDAFQSAAAGCPFNSGLYQLWRNQLMAIAIEKDPRFTFDKVTFSVVRHPRNRALDATLANYTAMIGDRVRFSILDSVEFVRAAERTNAPELLTWAAWYRSLYDLEAA